MTTHRIVQLTDCHLFSDPAAALRGVVTWPRLLAVLADVRKQVPEADLLVFSGDTTHDEERATYERLQGELGDWAGRVRFIPGNHDSRARLQDVFSIASGGPAERITFQEQWSDWQVIGLDSQQPGEVSGSLGAEQLGWLWTQLETTRRLHTLVFLHHPPTSVGSAWLDKIGLADTKELAEVLREHPQAKLVGCGHVHQELASSLGSATLFTTPAVGPPFRPRTEELVIDNGPPGYRVWELFSDGNWSTQVLHAVPSSG